MNKKILIFAFLFLSSTAFSFADDGDQVFTLKDGSQIKGVLSGVDNDVYTVKTPIIGDVHIAKNDVASITNGNGPIAAPATSAATSTTPSLPSSQPMGTTPNLDQQVAVGQQQLMSNPQSMQLLMQMAQNPEIAQALQDPALVQAVQSHDYQAVQNNPAVQKLMSNPQMQELIQKLAAQQQQQPQQKTSSQ